MERAETETATSFFQKHLLLQSPFVPVPSVCVGVNIVDAGTVEQHSRHAMLA